MPRFVITFLLVAGIITIAHAQSNPTEKQPVGAAAEKPKAGEWKNLYAEEQWYKDHKQPEQVFTGTLERHKEPEVSTLMRSHRYKLGERFLYPGKQNPELEKLVGQNVEVRGKPYDVELEGQSVSEIWPASIRPQPSASTEQSGTAVQARVIYGTDDKTQKGDVEDWIAKGLADAGSPVTGSYTGWITLSGEDQELYASMQGGRLIKGRAVEKDNGFQVKISGFKITPLSQTITLEPGERKVVKLTDYPAPRNVFIAIEVKVYIPKDLDDCFAELKRMLSKEQIEKMKNGTEKDMIDYHMGLGLWLRNNWGLWRGSRLSKWFNDKGIRHPDDMSGIIFDSFWRHLNGKPIKLDEQVKHYQDYWKKVEQERKEKK